MVFISACLLYVVMCPFRKDRKTRDVNGELIILIKNLIPYFGVAFSELKMAGSILASFQWTLKSPVSCPMDETRWEWVLWARRSLGHCSGKSMSWEQGGLAVPMPSPRLLLLAFGSLPRRNWQCYTFQHPNPAQSSSAPTLVTVSVSQILLLPCWPLL